MHIPFSITTAATITVIALVALVQPAFGQAQTNPFKPGAVSRPASEVFKPNVKAAPAVVLPPPLPDPLPSATELLPSSSVSGKSNSPAPSSPPASCPIEITPQAPLVGAQGGQFTLRLKGGKSARSCVAAIESRAAWLQIRFFNGHELAVYAEPNKGARARHGELIFANAADALLIQVVQAAP